MMRVAMVPVFSVDDVETAMYELAVLFADGLSETGEAHESEIPAAIRQPVSMGAVLFDLARLLGIDPPPAVRLAVEDAPAAA